MDKTTIIVNPYENKIYGFIIINENSCLFGRLVCVTDEIIDYFSIHTEHSANPSQIEKEEINKRKITFFIKTHNLAYKYFIKNNKCYVDGIIVAGHGNFKNKYIKSDLLDSRIKKAILKVVDIKTSLHDGFSDAIDTVIDFMLTNPDDPTF